MKENKVNLYPKVLIISHNSLSDNQNNGKTISSFFSEWPRDNLAQLYLQNEYPSFSICNRFYRITDYDMLKNMFHKGKIGKEIVEDNERNYLKNENDSFFITKMKKKEKRGIFRFIHNCFVKRYPFFCFARNFLWRKKRWKSDSLSKWIELFSPELVFFQGSSMSFGYEICEEIASCYRIPFVLELTDDYTSCLYKWSLMERLQKRKYIKWLKWGLNNSLFNMVISDEMQKEYYGRFGGKNHTFMNSVDSSEFICNEGGNGKFLYAGNLGIGRGDQLVNIAMALHYINQKENTNYVLDVYSLSIPNRRFECAVKKYTELSFNGGVSSRELHTLMNNYSYLIHTESYNKKMRKITKLSISTKIPEYLASGKPIFAYGPSEVASIKYLMENNLAFFCTDNKVSKLVDQLSLMLTDERKKVEVVKRAKLFAKEKHDVSRNARFFSELIEDGLYGKKQE